MRIAIEMAGYTVAEADRFRADVAKRGSPQRLQAHYRDFVYERAGHNGLDRTSAEKLWGQILKFAAYSFCKAHATVYAHIAWQTAFLKAHYLLAFYCSLFNNHHGMYPLRIYVWDAKRRGITILPPHVNASDCQWTVEGRAVRAGLGLTKGISVDTIQALVGQRRQKGNFRDLDDLRNRVAFRKRQ